MIVKRDTRAIILEAAKSWGMSKRKIGTLTRKRIEELADEKVVVMDDYGDDKEVLEKLVGILTEYKNTGRKSSLILSENRYVPPALQKELAKSMSSYHNLSGHSSIDQMIDNEAARLRAINPKAADHFLKTHEIAQFRIATDRKPTMSLMKLLRITPGDVAMEIGRTLHSDTKQGYGFRTFGSDNFVAVSWFNLYKAQALLKEGTLRVNLPKKMYGRALEATVDNKLTGKSYFVEFKQLPALKRGNEYLYEIAWKLFFITNSRDFGFKGMLHDKQEPPILYSTKHVIAAYLKAREKFAKTKGLRKIGDSMREINIYWQDNPFLDPNERYDRVAEILSLCLVFVPKTFELRPLSEVMLNQNLEMFIEGYGAPSFFNRLR